MTNSRRAEIDLVVRVSSPRILMLFVAMTYLSQMGQGRPWERGSTELQHIQNQTTKRQLAKNISKAEKAIATGNAIRMDTGPWHTRQGRQMK